MKLKINMSLYDWFVCFFSSVLIAGAGALLISAMAMFVFGYNMPWKVFIIMSSILYCVVFGGELLYFND